MTPAEQAARDELAAVQTSILGCSACYVRDGALCELHAYELGAAERRLASVRVRDGINAMHGRMRSLLVHVEQAPCAACGSTETRRATVYVSEQRFEARCRCGAVIEAAVERRGP